MNRPRVLLIDDEDELVQTLVERLDLRGVEAEAATDGHQGLERIHHVPFDVVVADLKMPGISGLEVIDILRQRYPAVKVILITGHGCIEDEDEYYEAGVHRILMKPFGIDALVDAIHDVLKQQQA